MFYEVWIIDSNNECGTKMKKREKTNIPALCRNPTPYMEKDMPLVYLAAFCVFSFKINFIR